MQQVRYRFVFCLAALTGLLATGTASGAPRDGQSAVVADRYIVVFDASVQDAREQAAGLGRRHGFALRHRYTHAVKGFAARLNERQLAALEASPKVAHVVPDRTVRALGTVPLAPGDVVPTGVRRIEAATTSTVRGPASVGVAVIDTGIDLDHPDLNVVAGPNCVGSAPPDDDNGHGTHVAGTIGARNDGAGVTGVAPGTRVVAAKVLDANGGGTWSQIICAIDWVTATRTDADPGNDISVANMSLGGAGMRVATCATTTDPLHEAICRSTAAGVTYVAAAGNSGWDFDYASAPDVPAAYPEVLTVAAVTDSDGKPGAAGGSPSCATAEKDDVYASFSNFAATSAGAAHTVAAPGTCINSTWPGGGYQTISGTSMATPHVSGVVALCLDEAGHAGPCAGLAPADVVQVIRRDARDRTLAAPGYGFSGDPTRPLSGRYYGHLAWTRAPDTTAPTVSSVVPASDVTGVSPAATASVTFSETMAAAASEAAFSLVRSSDGAAVTGSFSWSDTTMTFDPGTDLAPGTKYTARIGTGAQDLAGNPLSTEVVWSFTTASPPATTTYAPASVVVQTGSLRSGDATRLRADDGAYYQVNSTTSSTRTSSWYARFASVSNALTSLKATYSGRNSRTCAQTISVWRWTTSSWVQLDSRSVGTNEVGVALTPGGTLANYVSGTSGDGEVRIRIRCTTTSGSFYASGDLLTITVGR